MAADHRYPSGRFDGRGIVICAGGARLFTCAWVVINVLRRLLGCTLPITLWHIGPRELGGTEASLLEPLDVEIVDALEVARSSPARKLGGWELKAYALVHCRFEQVLLLDADNVPVVDPAFLFDLPELADAGAIVWPDLVQLSPGNPIWELCGVTYRSEPSWESGQLLVDKSRCWRALQIALHMNMHSESFYDHTHGDKDTFHLAWILAGAAWAIPDHPTRATTTGLYQRDFEGRLLFQHRSQAKWRLSGGNPVAENFRHQDECLRFISELRDRWSGRIDGVPSRSARDHETEDGLREIRWFKLESAGEQDRLLELLPGNRTGVGSSRGRILRWYVRDGVLRFDGASGALPPLQGGPTTFATADGSLQLRPAPEAGQDTLGLAAAAVLERFVEDQVISEADAIATLSTLARIGELDDALDRARSRWDKNDAALAVIEQAARQISLGSPGSIYHGVEGYERTE